VSTRFADAAVTVSVAFALDGGCAGSTSEKLPSTPADALPTRCTPSVTATGACGAATPHSVNGRPCWITMSEL